MTSWWDPSRLGDSRSVVSASWLAPPLGQTAYVLFQKAFSFPDVEGLYLLTDGKPDTSCSLILSEVQRLKEKRDIKVHTISLDCSCRWATRRQLSCTAYLPPRVWGARGCELSHPGPKSRGSATRRPLSRHCTREGTPLKPCLPVSRAPRLSPV